MILFRRRHDAVIIRLSFIYADFRCRHAAFLLSAAFFIFADDFRFALPLIIR